MYIEDIYIIERHKDIIYIHFIYRIRHKKLTRKINIYSIKNILQTYNKNIRYHSFNNIQQI